MEAGAKVTDFEGAGNEGDKNNTFLATNGNAMLSMLVHELWH